MRTEARPVPPPPVTSPSEQPADGVRSWLLSLLVVGSVAVAIMAFFLSIYAANHLPVPLGWDTSKYLWRTSLLKAVGFADMTKVVPVGTGVDPGRPGFPVIAATLSAGTGISPFRLAAVLPGVSAAAIGLGAGAFVAVALRRPTWELVATALFVGMSAFVVRLAGPETYQDNLFAAAVFVTAAIPIALSLFDRRALVPAIVLLAAGGVIHWAFFLFMAGTLALTVAAYVPGSIRAWRSGRRPLLDTPAARVGTVLAGAGAVVGVTILGVLGKPHTPKLSIWEFRKKLRQDIPKYKFRITLPIAAVGAAALGLASRRRKGDGTGDPDRARFVLTLLLAWSLVTLSGYLAFKVGHLDIPAHRFLAFCLAVPILAALGIVAAGRWVARWARAAAVVVVVAALAAAAYQSHVVLFRFQTWMDPAKIEDATQAGAYIQAARIAGDRPLVFLVGQSDSSYTALMGHMIKLSLPADRIGKVYLFMGSAQDYLAHRPLAGSSGPNPISVRYLHNLEPTYAQNPVALILLSFDAQAYGDWVAAHPHSEVTRHVAVVRGPLPTAAVPRARSPIGGLGAFRVGVFGVVAMAVLAAVGLGWAVLLLHRWLRPAHLLAIAPAVGIAAVVVAGIVVDRVGIRLVGAGGIASLLLAAGSPWPVLGIRRLRAARS